MKIKNRIITEFFFLINAVIKLGGGMGRALVTLVLVHWAANHTVLDLMISTTCRLDILRLIDGRRDEILQHLFLASNCLIYMETNTAMG